MEHDECVFSLCRCMSSRKETFISSWLKWNCFALSITNSTHLASRLLSFYFFLSLSLYSLISSSLHPYTSLPLPHKHKICRCRSGGAPSGSFKPRMRPPHVTLLSWSQYRPSYIATIWRVLTVPLTTSNIHIHTHTLSWYIHSYRHTVLFYLIWYLENTLLNS